MAQHCSAINVKIALQKFWKITKSPNLKSEILLPKVELYATFLWTIGLLSNWLFIS